MEIFLVGGAVRNQLLGLPVKERDWVVVGATAEEMRALGYRPVGKDFPVFLHPSSKEEYALARTERKTGKGHTGFECDTEAVTLEDDLRRRDLTINAIARDQDGSLIDPWGGVADIEGRVLRHISDAFAEDPLRVLRVARFAAAFETLGFTVHPSTLALMKTMTQRGDLAELSVERIWLELEKALTTDHPVTFFKVLASVGAATILWPEIPAEALARLDTMAGESDEKEYRFAALLLGLSDESITALCDRLRVPNRYADLARVASANYAGWLDGENLGETEVVAFLYALDSFRQRGRFRTLNDLLARLAAANGVPGTGTIAAGWERCFEAARDVSAKDVDAGLSGEAIGRAIRREQATRVAALRGS